MPFFFFLLSFISKRLNTINPWGYANMIMSIRFQKALLLALSCISLASFAAPISPEQALERVAREKSLQAERRLLLKATGNTFSNSLIFTEKRNNTPTIYLFHLGEKTLCLSADDALPPVLGFADGYVEPKDFPPAFTAWMNTISQEIASAREGVVAIEDETDSDKEDFESIAPLCQTKWNQDNPYNLLCPKLSGAANRCYTGCVATAMAQVMKYHNWPEVGEGSISYKWEIGNLSLKADFSKQIFDWDHMLDSYDSKVEYTEEEAVAVASLMRNVGISVEMSYSDTASGAMSQYIAGALGKYFKYDKGTIRYVMRDYYSLAEWEEMIYNSLKNYGPVILDGQSNQGGHSFVCDGYDKDGYFHINWGWGGVSDGYYLLSVLDPYNQGIGGSGDNSGFNFMQDAIIGITPAKESNPDDAWYTQLYGYGQFGLDTSLEYAPGDGVGPLCEDGIYNFGPMALPADASLGILFREANEDGVEEKKINETGKEYVWGINLEEEVGVLYGFGEFVLPLPEEIPNGNYNVTLAYQSPSLNWGNWMDVLFREDTNSTYAAIVKDGVIRFNASDWRPTDVEEIEMAGEDQPKLYFNLQGMPIQNPAKGEIVIVKEGKKSYKRAF